MNAALANVYRDPRAARRQFDVRLAFVGRIQAMRALSTQPETFGKLRWSVRAEQVQEATAWAGHYARWQIERHGLRPLREAVTELLRAANTAATARGHLQMARGDFHEAANRYAGKQARDRDAIAAEEHVTASLREVYRHPEDARQAIEEYHKLHGTSATVQAIESTPKQFGHVSGLGLFSSSEAKRKASGRAWRLAGNYGRAFRARADRPNTTDLASAESAMRDAERGMKAAESRWSAYLATSPEQQVKAAARLLRQAAHVRQVPVAHLMRRISPRLPIAAARLAFKVLEAVDQQERQEQRREIRGLDIGF